MAPNSWKFKALEHINWWKGPSEVKLVLTKRDVRGGFDLGRAREQKFTILEDINFALKNRLYWKEIFKTIWSCGDEWDVKVPVPEIKKMIKNIRWVRYQGRRPRFKVWGERYGKFVAKWAMNIIETEIDDPCKDNFRLARNDDKKALRKYEQQCDSGCCGFFDVERRCPYDWFRKYYIGCNYGH
jgi:hypothetical protein